MESQQKHLPIEEMEVFRRFVEIADWAWSVVIEWIPLARDSVGRQLIRAADSVGANLVEGDGRHSDADALHFFMIARASARETRYWLERAISRQLMTPEEGQSKIAAVSEATRILNGLIAYRRGRTASNRVKENKSIYEAAMLDSYVDPFAEDLFPDEEFRSLTPNT